MDKYFLDTGGEQQNHHENSGMKSENVKTSASKVKNNTNLSKILLAGASFLHPINPIPSWLFLESVSPWGGSF